MLSVKCVTCGRLAGSPAAPCGDCRESFLSPELVFKMLQARDDASILGIYVRDDVNDEWVKEDG
jgi:hypothetical protein